MLKQSLSNEDIKLSWFSFECSSSENSVLDFQDYWSCPTTAEIQDILSRNAVAILSAEIGASEIGTNLWKSALQALS